MVSERFATATWKAIWNARVEAGWLAFSHSSCEAGS